MSSNKHHFILLSYIQALLYKFFKHRLFVHYPLVALSTQENIKLFKYLESGFKRIINWNKFLAKNANQA